MYKANDDVDQRRGTPRGHKIEEGVAENGHAARWMQIHDTLVLLKPCNLLYLF